VIAFAGLVPLLLSTPVVIEAGAPKTWDELSGVKAFAHVQRFVDFGPRPPGSDAIEKSKNYIEEQLRRSGWQVTRQPFSDNTPQGKVQFVNLIDPSPRHGKTLSLFLVCSH